MRKPLATSQAVASCASSSLIPSSLASSASLTLVVKGSCSGPRPFWRLRRVISGRSGDSQLSARSPPQLPERGGQLAHGGGDSDQPVGEGIEGDAGPIVERA